MNILVVGNGFDLAHGLPTSYSNCLDFLKIIESISLTYQEPFRWRSKLWRDRVRLDKKYQVFPDEYISFLRNFYSVMPQLARLGPDEKFEDLEIHFMYQCIRKNLWLSHFWACQERNEYIRPNWIDFESEMSLVVQKIESVLKDAQENSLTTSELNKFFFDQQDLKMYPHFQKIGSELIAFIRRKFRIPVSIEIAGPSVVELLYGDLRAFTTAIEIYLKISTRVAVYTSLPDIKEIGIIDKIISFNYTDTSLRYMEMKRNIPENICFVHGKIRDCITDTESPLVLGISEYLEGEDRDKNVDWAAFKKYFQRLYKHTDYAYRDWGGLVSSSASESYEDFENYTRVYIFGHSLDVTDCDILREVILRDKQITTIFYRNTEELSDKLKNMLKVLGHKELNARMRSKNPTILFKKQLEIKSPVIQNSYTASRESDGNTEYDTVITYLKRIISDLTAQGKHQKGRH